MAGWQLLEEMSGQDFKKKIHGQFLKNSQGSQSLNVNKPWNYAQNSICPLKEHGILDIRTCGREKRAKAEKEIIC